MSSDNSDGSNIKSMENTDHTKRREEMKDIVIDAISKECMNFSESTHDDVCAVAKGLSSGRKLQASVIMGGYCNYSYKVHFEDDNSSSPKDDIALFAKLTFGAPAMIPDAPPCSHERTQCEYDMMEIYSKVTPYPDSAITPYFCLDIVDNKGDNDGEAMKLLVTEFSSKFQEQAAKLFVEATMDTKLAVKLAKILSSLHNARVLRPDFNNCLKPFFYNLTYMLSAVFDEYLAEDENDDGNDDSIDGATKFARMLGKERLDEIMKVYREVIKRTDCYVHGDVHVFNMLVAASTTDLDNHRSSGDFALLDWEFSHCGPIGKDIGFFHAFPLACAFSHAINGDITSCEGILHFLDTLWIEYSVSVESDVKLADIFCQALGFSSIFLLGYSALGYHMEYVPIDDQEGKGAKDLAKVKESLGIIGLKFISTGFVDDNTLSLLELRNKFHESVNEEVQRLLPNQEK